MQLPVDGVEHACVFADDRGIERWLHVNIQPANGLFSHAMRPRLTVIRPEVTLAQALDRTVLNSEIAVSSHRWVKYASSLDEYT
ncbi:hypothetical protein [Methylobacterium bullatum]|uniref:hypothetical protein n=1 Tax=Methylobacterium bullatum TaxID=570505 RepID=UPI00178016F2|nr:hypothetical protein [Methylobacterium bullatum]